MSTNTPYSLTSADVPPQPSFDFQSSMIPGYVLQLLSIGFYIAVLIVVHRIRKCDKESKPFYTIFFYIGLVDIVHAVALIWMRFEHEVIKGDAFLPFTHLCSFATCYCYLVHIIGNTIMAINRYSATYKNHHVHFSKIRNIIYLVMTHVFAGISSIPAAFRVRNYAFEDGKWTITLSPEWLIKFQRYTIIGWMALYFFIAPLFTYMAYKRIAIFIHSDRYHPSDKTLLYFITVHMICHTWMLFYEIFEIARPESPFIAFAHEYFFSVFFFLVVSNGAILTISTIRVRRGLSKLLCNVVDLSRAKVSQSNTTLVVTERY